MGKQKSNNKQTNQSSKEAIPYRSAGAIMEEHVEVKRESFRPLVDVFLFIAFLASLAIYFNQDDWFGSTDADEVILVDISVDDLLLNKTGLIDDNLDRFLSEIKIGHPISETFDTETQEYIEKSYRLVVNTSAYTPKNIVIYEVVDQEKRRAKVNDLLIQANNYFEEDKLTTPEFENAYSKYQYVLSLDPENTQAIEGIKNIINRYVFLIDKVIDKKEIYKVPILIESVRSVGEGYVDTVAIVNKYKDYLNEEDLFYHSRESYSQENIVVNAERSLKKNHYASQKIVEADYQISQVAMDLIKNDKADTALKILSDFVSLYPAKSQAYDLLLQLYLDKGDSQSAENIIYQNVQFESVYLAEKTARVFIARGDYENALTLLESHKPEFNGNPDYYYLLAGLYLKLHDYHNAHNIYERLVFNNRYNAYYWFGLAVVLDAKGDAGALTSFGVARKNCG